MSEQAAEGSEPIAPWLLATVADVGAVDINKPVVNSTDADARALGELYHKRAAELEAEPAGVYASAVAVYRMLAVILQMHFKPSTRNEPYGPWMVMEGRRTAIPADFRRHVAVLAALADQASHPVVKARVADLCWLLDRKRAAQGFQALRSYVEIVERMERGESRHRFHEKEGVLHHASRDLLLRALTIGNALGREKDETVAACSLAKRLRETAMAGSSLIEVQRFSCLDLDFRISDPAEVASAIEVSLKIHGAVGERHTDVELWRLAARGHALAKQDADRDRCLTEAAEALVAQADRCAGSAMLAAHWLAQAIVQLGRIPGQRERRTALRHRLIDVQGSISEELNSIDHEMDLSEMAEQAQTRLDQRPLFDQLFIFAFISEIPDPARLRKHAMTLIEEHPLSSMLSTTHMDREGKVIHRTEGGMAGDDGHESAIVARIAQSEDIRRAIVSNGAIEAARHAMTAQRLFDSDLLEPLLAHTPFIPDDLLRTFSTGFAKFLQGDFTSALYILTPLLENSLRHVLKQHGHDVTIFDDATQTQQDRTISSLYEQMRPELDAIFGITLTSDIDRLFLQKPGPHLRHAVAHGLLSDGDTYGTNAIYACWLMWRLCLYPLVPHRAEIARFLEGTDLMVSRTSE